MIPKVQELRDLRALVDEVGRDFVIGFFLPISILVGITIALYFEARQGLGTFLAELSKYTLQTLSLVLIGLLVIIAALSYAVYKLQEWPTRWFQGEWWRLPWPRSWRMAVHQQRLNYLTAQVTQLESLTAQAEELDRQRVRLKRLRCRIPFKQRLSFPSSLRKRLYCPRRILMIRSRRLTPDRPLRKAFFRRHINLYKRRTYERRTANLETNVNAREEDLQRLLRNYFSDTPDRISSAKTRRETERVVEASLTFYPPPALADELMPTRIGNIVRTAELFIYYKYGIEFGTVWPQLRSSIDPEVVVALEAKRTELSFMQMMSLLIFVFTIVWCLLLIAFIPVGWKLFLLYLVVSLLGWSAALLYFHNAVQSALEYSRQMRITFIGLSHVQQMFRNHDLNGLPVETEEPVNEWLRKSSDLYRSIPTRVAPGAVDPETG